MDCVLKYQCVLIVKKKSVLDCVAFKKKSKDLALESNKSWFLLGVTCGVKGILEEKLVEKQGAEKKKE